MYMLSLSDENTVLLKKAILNGAIDYYTKSAQGGNIAAQRSLAYLYLKGLATTADYDASLSWYTKAAEAGDSEAQVILGDCIKQDLPNAVKWYSQAARQGNIVTQNCLSQLHQRGIINGNESCKQSSNQRIK
ncbi:hypothetical protein K501DRAFT_274619 [Backusella circina FSU 941]|nr:hypothetical protein K501DRAFT_274619 [Backusella circina FSU 941]